MPDEEPAQWVRVHRPASSRARPGGGSEAYRVRIEAGGTGARVDLGACGTARPARPDGTATRLLSAAADQVGPGAGPGPARGRGPGRRDRAPERRPQVGAAPVGLARPPDAAGDDPGGGRHAASRTAGSVTAELEESADAIDREVEYLNRLVTNLLDLSRIEAGALRAERDVFELDDLVGADRGPASAAPGRAPARGGVDALAVSVDPIFFDEARRPTSSRTPSSTRRPARRSGSRGHASPRSRSVRLTIEDARPGRAARGPAAAVREVLSRRRDGARLALRDRASGLPWSAGSSRRWAADARPAGARSAALPSTWTCPLAAVPAAARAKARLA